MLRRFIHIGDLHLGPHARNADRQAALEQVIAENLHTDVAAWLWPGDLNHGRMTIGDKNYLTSAVRRMADRAPVVIGYGNHDLPGDLDFLAKLHARYDIFVVSRPEVIHVPLEPPMNELVEYRVSQAAIFVLPYPTRTGLVAAGVAPGDVGDAARLALKAIFVDAAERLRTFATKGVIPIVIGHVNVAGSIASNGQPSIGKEIEVDEDLLKLFEHTYIGLNHIHKAQEISGAVYAGSLCRLDWGEIDPKGYVEVTYGPGGWGGHSGDGPWDGCQYYAFDWGRRPIAVAPLYKVEGELTRDGFTWTFEYDGETFTQAQTGVSFVGADVRVRFRFNAEDKALLDFEAVKRPFAGARRLETDPVAVRSRAARSPEVLSAVSFEAKTQAFVKNSGQAWTPSLELKLAALQAVEWNPAMATGGQS